MLPFDLSKIPSKVWLSGSDCFHLVLDKHSQKNKAGGNVMHKLFYFNEPLPCDSILQTLQSSAIIYWLCNIEIVYGSLLRIPFWKFTNQGRQPVLHQYKHTVEQEIPAEVLNRDIPLNAERFIEFSCVQYPSGASALVMSWNHILMDGKGTVLLLQHLEELAQGKPNQFGHFFPVKDKRPNILGYISNMYKVKAFIQKSSKAPIASVAPKANPAIAGFQFKTIHFTKEETKKMDVLAFEKGAKFGANLFHLSCCLHTVNDILQQKKKAGTMWIPVPYDGRLRGAVGPIISNRVSYLFYRIPQEQLQSIEKTISYLNGQMTDQIKVGMPQRYNKLLDMMRHIPLWLYYFLISRTGDGAFSSFLYSTTGNNFNEFQSIFGQAVAGLTVYPCPTYPPGLTFIFVRHLEALNISFAYSPADINTEDLNYIEQSLRRLLLLPD